MEESLERAGFSNLIGNWKGYVYMRIIITCIALALVPCLLAGPTFPDEQSDIYAVE